MNALYEKFNNEVKPQLIKEFGYKNEMAVPGIEKVSLNVGLSKATSIPHFIEDVKADLKAISGQSPVSNKARKSIAGFKIREGQTVGLSVTLRGERMWDFVYKLISVAIPRIKDFQGIEERNFDQKGNFSYGIKEQIIFPEISPDEINTIFGFQVNIATGTESKKEGLRLLKLLGFPLKSEK